MGAKTVLARRCDEATRGIGETRLRIRAKADLLQGRLKPRAVLKPVTKRLQGTLGEGGEKILEAFRENPLPLSLAGLGLGWLILSDLRGERLPSDSGSELKEKAGEELEKTQDVAHRAGEAAAAVPRKVRKAAHDASDWFSATLEENPMLLALGVLAAGLLAGLSIPAGAKEEETVGKLGEHAAEKILEKGTETLEKREAAVPAPAPSDASPAGIEEAKD